ncbi:hypothetical protein [Geoalkalibacter halelectricus]|uniref:Uncharacterized protein n=1 Tax=Geoalkalibacter halelectricus TaxID=2847045 RepID=A0ABY5ZMD2_9BACT|nr:hypothetical protein [Geoalkalibacter halelectricus]MDO3378353.1 hypothetical protein [Geoalkalibacter halelectricus]UWZ80327.1 hypothetical protein L9S41_02730 [Geoalkalibacter halelectricus]
MQQALRKEVIIKSGGIIEIQSSELQEGTRAEVIILVGSPSQKPSLRNLIGAGKGCFASPGEVDRFLRHERDQWP